MTTLESLVNSSVPRCLSDVHVARIEPFTSRAYVSAAFALSAVDNTDAEVLGYPLSDYNPNCKDDPDFVGPLSLRWSPTASAVVFDSDIHGYHGEMDSSAKIRGEGDPKSLTCDCGNSRFRVDVQFDYCDACEDLVDEEPDLPAHDYFSNVVFRGTCTACGNTHEILNMDL
tara:strand:+ start:19 stop:531 length:513 start_codon:yes stop_codon:yes gene_type:complete